MFYLKEWALILWDLRARGLFFVLSGLMLALSLAFRPTVGNFLAELAPEAYARPYFTALFDSSVSKSEVMAELQDHAEIAEVQQLAKAEAQGPLGRLIAQLGSEYSLGQSVTAFGVRVVLKGADMIPQGQEIRQALESGHGATHVTTSEVKMPRVTGLFGTHPIFRYLAQFGFAGIAVPLFLVWVAAFFLCSPHFTRRAWLVERYQRRQLVRAKTVAAGLGVIAGLAAVWAVMVQGPDLIGFGLLLSAFSIPWATTMREVQWRSQN
jgi:hypothetical protein